MKNSNTLQQDILIMIAAVVRAMKDTSKDFDKTAKLVAALFNKHGFAKAYAELRKALPSVSRHEWTRLYALGKGRLLLETYLCSRHSRSKRLLLMSLHDQIRLQNGVNVFVGDDQPSVKLTMNQMNCRQFNRAVDEKGHIRNIVSQRAYVSRLRLAADSPVRWTVDYGKIRVLSTGTIDAEDLDHMVAELEG